MKRIGYLGPEGTYTEEAALKYCNGSKGVMVPFSTIDGVVEGVEGGLIDVGVVPIENSLEGAVTVTLDVLAGDTEVKIFQEILCPIKHSLMVPKGQRKDEIKEIYSHPQALAQCRISIQRLMPGAIIKTTLSTAEGALIASKGNGIAAIASPRAAEIYGLEIISYDIQDEVKNITRFLVLAKDDNAPTGRDKTSLVLGLEERPGTLCSLLNVLAKHDINLTKIESRPMRGEIGRYKFFLDLEGHRLDGVVERALKEAQGVTTFMKILGSYPRAGSV